MTENGEIMIGIPLKSLMKRDQNSEANNHKQAYTGNEITSE